MGFWNKKSSVNYASCHEGTIKVFEDPSTGVPYYGGGLSRDLVIYKDHLIVAMADIDIESVYVYNLDAPNLLKYNNPAIRIVCPDFGTPDLEKQFWLDLIKTINAEWVAKRIAGVTVCCIGGHGRTGTALSILAGLTGACQSDPVLFIRENYCKKVVESKAQANYIQEITGIKVTAEPSKVYSGYTSYASPYESIPKTQAEFDWDSDTYENWNNKEPDIEVLDDVELDDEKLDDVAHDYYGYSSFDEYQRKNKIPII